MIQKQIARWAVMAVAVPVAAAGARRLSQNLESRRGSNRTSRLLTRGADLLRPAKASRRRRFF